MIERCLGPGSRRGWLIAGLTLTALVLGPLISLGTYGVMGSLVADGTVSPEEYPYSEEFIFAWMLVDTAVGLVAVALLPIALRRAPEPKVLDEGPEVANLSLKEPRSALVAALVIGVLVGVSGAAFPAWFIAVVSVCSRGIRKWVFFIPPVAVLSAVGSVFVVPMPESDIWVILMGIALSLAMTAVPVLIGLNRWSRRRQIRALRSEAATARREAEAVVREEQARAAKTRAEERTRIAREMHDTLSHRLALISTYAGALDYREDLDRDTVRSTARLVQQTAATASAELRTVLDVLRDDPTDTRPEPDLTQVDSLLEEVRATGAQVESLVQRPDLGQIPGTASRTLYRMLQEGLTNAVKHAPGAPVTVRWQGDDDEVRLTVTNPLTPSDHADSVHPASGFGLIGLDERARALGGSVRATETQSEFRLEAKVPCRS